MNGSTIRWLILYFVEWQEVVITMADPMQAEDLDPNNVFIFLALLRPF
jgi:hypothetical protein